MNDILIKSLHCTKWDEHQREWGAGCITGSTSDSDLQTTRAQCQHPRVEDHSLSAVHDRSAIIFANALHIWKSFPTFANWVRAMQ
jgi:hypothetical protein